MSYYHEFEPYLEEFMEYGLGAGLLTNGFSSLLGIATYVLTALALYTMAQRRGIKNAWLSWVPVINCWIIGSLSDQYRYVVKGEVKNKRKTLLILNIINWVLTAVLVIGIVGMAVRGIRSAMGPYSDDILGSVIGAVAGVAVLSLPIAGISIALAVIRYMALYDIYTSCQPQNNVLFLVLSIIFRITEPFFLFLCRDKDEGMPPRKQEPVYTPPQEPWNDPEYL